MRIFSSIPGSCTEGFCRPSRKVSSFSRTFVPAGISGAEARFQSYIQSLCCMHPPAITQWIVTGTQAAQKRLIPNPECLSLGDEQVSLINTKSFFMLNRNHAQTLRWYGRSRLGPVLQLIQSINILRRQPAPANIQ